MRQIYFLWGALLALSFSPSLLAQDCSTLIQDAHQIGQAQLVRSQVKILVMRGVDAYSVQFLCDKSGLQLKIFSKGSSRLEEGDELIFGAQDAAFLNIAFETRAEQSKVGETPVSVNTLQLDSGSLAWLANHDISTLYIRKADQEQLRKYTLDPQRQTELNGLVDCFAQTVKSELVTNRPSNAQEVKYPGAARIAGNYVRSENQTADNTTDLLARNSSPDNNQSLNVASDRDIAALKEEREKVKQAREQLAAERDKLEAARLAVQEEVSANRAEVDKQAKLCQAQVAQAREEALSAVKAAEEQSKEQIKAQHEQAVALLAEKETHLKARLEKLSALEAEKVAESEQAIAEREAQKQERIATIAAAETAETEALKAKRAEERAALLAEWESEKERIQYAKDKMIATFEAEQEAINEALTQARAEHLLQLQSEREKAIAQVKETRENARKAVEEAQLSLQAEIARLQEERTKLQEKHQQIIAEMHQQLATAKAKLTASLEQK